MDPKLGPAVKLEIVEALTLPGWPVADLALGFSCSRPPCHFLASTCSCRKNLQGVLGKREVPEPTSVDGRMLFLICLRSSFAILFAVEWEPWHLGLRL